LRFLGFVAACTVATLTACSGGGSTGVIPTGQQSPASTLSSTTVSSVGRSSSDNGDCQTGGRHEHAVARASQDHEGQDGGDKASSSCCPTTGAGATPTPGPVTGTRDHARRDDGGEGQDQGNSSCCPTTITPGGSGGTGTPGSRDRARRSDDGGSSSCHVPGPLTVMPSTVAIGYLRGNKNIKTPLTFVRFEPYVVPKKSLTGDSTERVDTRVLQVIFRFERGDLPFYIGQQMDVFIDTPEPIQNRNGKGVRP
jgi:hypothetical protein